MKKKPIAFVVVGVLAGFVLGFFVNEYIDQPTSAGPPQVAAGGQGQLPAGHPPIDALEQIRQLEEHAQEHPEHADVKVQLGNAYFDLQRFQEAVNWYQQALEQEPNNIAVNSDLGIAYYFTGDVPKAIETLERSLNMEKDHPVALRNLGWVYFASGRFDEAIRYWERLVEVHPEFQDIEAIKEQLENARAHSKGEHS